MVANLCASSSLETVYIGFKSPQRHPRSESRSLHPPERSILPALNNFRFKGVAEYLEELVTFIDAPQLNTLNITFPRKIDSDFDTRRLAQFINRAPKLSERDAHVQFDDYFARVGLPTGSGPLPSKYPHALNLIGSFCPSGRSVTPLFTPLPRLRTSISSINIRD